MNFSMFKFLLLASLQDLEDARNKETTHETFDQWFEEFIIFLGYTVEDKE